ncbi:hypothetical protein [Kitasatospora paranensis]|uniref:VCBS repeat-containing protein n=1 Tax=Kitasatospora paranensis TaxID=258053 RepID=A0ABW2G3L8_9ACTN
MFRTSSPRRLASAVAVVFAAGLLAAPAASAAAEVKVSDPAVLPGPGFFATGAHTDACDATTVPGWISTATPQLTVHATGDRARFTIKDSGGRKVFAAAATPAAGAAAVAATGLVDGGTYSWFARSGGQQTADCHFRVDTTAPSLTVASTDFPSSDSGGTPQKYAGQTGTFTLAGSDAASGVACYRYVLDGTLGTGGGCDAAGTVLAAADGSATLRIKPTQWGTNVLQVQAFDNAGNAAQPVAYTFYAPSDPNPPSAPGDVNGDGVPDILLPDAAGNLQVISADAATATPSSTTPAAYGPLQTWAGRRLVHRGWDNHAPGDDLLAHEPGSANLYLYRNLDAGAFQGSATLLARPSGCAAAGCATDWSQADQLVSLGALGTGTRPSLASVEGGDLWLFTNPGIMYRYNTVKRLSTTGAWAGYDLVAPGAAADGSLALWSRERATGALRTYPVVKNADGTYDFSALADPASGSVVATLPVADYPTLGSSGDGNGDGRPDLYAVNAAGHLLTFDGVTAPKDLGALR